MYETAVSPSQVQCRERRAAVRYVTAMEASYNPVAVRALGPCRPARIWDISMDGMGLVVERPPEVGATLGVQPEALPACLADGLEVRVVHVRPHGDGRWMIGTVFLEPLTEEQLRALLG